MTDKTPPVADDDDDTFDASKLIIRPGIPSMHDDLAFWEREHKDADALNAKLPKN